MVVWESQSIGAYLQHKWLWQKSRRQRTKSLAVDKQGRTYPYAAITQLQKAICSSVFNLEIAICRGNLQRRDTAIPIWYS